MPRNQSQAPYSGWITFLAHLLFVLAAWSVFIKYVFPIHFALFTDEAWTTHVSWDLWPVAHAWLGWALLIQPWYTRWLAVSMSIIEVVIIITLLSVFLSGPEWTIWRTNWFINKVFVLAAFTLILATVVVKPKLFRTRSP